MIKSLADNTIKVNYHNCQNGHEQSIHQLTYWKTANLCAGNISQQARFSKEFGEDRMVTIDNSLLHPIDRAIALAVPDDQESISISARNTDYM